MVISDNIISLFKLRVSSKALQIRPFPTYSINPPPFLFLSRRVRISYWISTVSLENSRLIFFLLEQNNVVKIYSTVFLDQPLCNEYYLCLDKRSRHCLGVFSYFQLSFVCVPIKVNHFFAVTHLRFL